MNESELTKGPYELDEERKPLTERPNPKDWTEFEKALFNLVTFRCDRNHRRLFFSKRVKAVAEMLKAMDKVINGPEER